jgi:hypothetical protein
MTMELKRFARPWPLAATALMALTIFGASVQMGLLVPHFGNPLGGQSGFATSNYSAATVTLTNESWRSWTLTSVHLDNGRTTQLLPNGSPVQLEISHLVTLDWFRPQHYGTVPLSVGPGRQFTLVLVQRHQPICPGASFFHDSGAQFQRYIAGLESVHYRVPVAVDVRTPLGTRSVITTFLLGDSCRDA